MAPTQQQLRTNKAKVIAGIVKAPKARIQRYLKNTTESQVQESYKSTLLLKGTRCSDTMTAVLKEIRRMTAPHSKLLSKTNPIIVFNDIVGQQSLEFLLTKNDCCLFGMGSHNKKRPNNLIIGRTFNNTVLDVAELGVTYFKSMMDYGGGTYKKRTGSKPLLIFNGDIWSTDFSNLQNLLIDFYRGDVINKFIANGIDHVITFTAVTDTTNTSNPITRIHQRTYFIQLKKNAASTSSSSNSPKLAPVGEYTPCGPDMDFIVRRTQWADAELARAARKRPGSHRQRRNVSEDAQVPSQKNTKTNLFGETLGRLHVEKQHIDTLGGRKVKAIRRADATMKQEERDAISKDLENEQQN